MSVSNLRIFLVCILLLMTAVSCERNKNDVIPDVYVDFYVDLRSDVYFFDFVSTITSSVYISASTNNWGPRAAGYDGNGIILYHALWDEFYAFDRTCPHCFVTESLSKAVNIDGIYAVCPQCSTYYALPNFGGKSSGPGQYPLKNYKTGLSGTYLHVWNN